MQVAMSGTRLTEMHPGPDLHDEAQADHRQQRGRRAVMAQREQAVDGVDVGRKVEQA
jgi:hypothetical protein